jgi:hypothetical protein
MRKRDLRWQNIGGGLPGRSALGVSAWFMVEQGSNGG